ncbi:MAG TPA: ABC transporter permease subunit [Chromobacteriaceae bacterium]|nr:ABC transporter permease subunit [Chromobacteriaceae bacterium]
MAFDFSQIGPALPGMADGMMLTLKLLGMAVAGGVVLGTLLALARLSSQPVLSRLARYYVNIFRSIPLLLVISWFYLVVPMIISWITGNLEPVGAFTSCLVAFVMFEAAYFSEIVRAGIQSIAKGQINAAYALGMTYAQAMRLVILPQAFRKMMPLLLQQSIILFQDTSLVYAVGLMDFLNTARSKGDIIGLPHEFLIFAGAVYFVISFGASIAVKRLQKRLAV